MMEQEKQRTRLSWSDALLAYTVLPLIPRSLKPNHVTVVRMFATPILLVLLMYDEYIWGSIAFLFVAFTDALDGAMARTRGQITEWGKVYDPLADKLLVGSIIIVLIIKQLDVYLGISILGIELLFIGSAWWRLKTGRAVQANVWGKIKMFLQVVGVIAVLLALATDWSPLLPFSKATFLLAILFALMSLVTHGI